MVGSEVHFLPEATILSKDGETLIWGSLSLGILVPSSATLWVSYAAGLSGLAFLWLSVTLLGTSAPRPDRLVWIGDPVSLQLRSANAPEWVLTLPSLRWNW